MDGYDPSHSRAMSAIGRIVKPPRKRPRRKGLRTMRAFRFDKLIRDGVLTAMHRSGWKVAYRRLDHAEHLRSLFEKLVEEAIEARDAKPDDRPRELADLQILINSIKNHLGSTERATFDEEYTKRCLTHSFDNGVYVETVIVPDDSRWIEHFEAQPRKYPEIPVPQG